MQIDIKLNYLPGGHCYLYRITAYKDAVKNKHSKT